ncbi:MAG: hypothetical protein IPO15_20920 [Anaerolineae bacterium]|uniref:hypothetical protein n=1 Tax=Candidatus Amarolinea dominans TaxID=3140696 RepID=UPI003135EEDF|nr:hypothetical protein [Anaerolineae bacterium]
MYHLSDWETLASRFGDPTPRRAGKIQMPVNGRNPWPKRRRLGGDLDPGLPSPSGPPVRTPGLAGAPRLGGRVTGLSTRLAELPQRAAAGQPGRSLLRAISCACLAFMAATRRW